MPRRPAPGLVVAFFASLVLALSSPAADAPDPSVTAARPPASLPVPLPPAPPAVAVEGTLPNGVRYLVLAHASPKNDLSLRLVVHAGSLDERDDERGFAHFVEHMGFNGTRTHPPGTVLEFFEKLGLTWGADLNAHTTPTHTVYALDLPAGRTGELGEALSVLRDYADGMLFLPEEVAREAPVVVSELRSRDNVRTRTARQVHALLYAGTPGPAREVGGDPDLLLRATPAQLRAFYARTYLPDRLTVVAVGPVEPAALVAKISAAFASLAAAPAGVPAAPAPPPLPPAPAGVVSDVLLVPTSTALVVNLVSIQPRPADDAAGRRAERVQQIATRALNARLGGALDADLTPFGAARAEQAPGLSAALVEHTIEVQTSFHRWVEAIAFAESELRRVRQQGFLQLEIDEAVAAALTAARDAVPRFASESAAQVSGQIERDLAAGRAWRSPAAALPGIEATLGTLGAAEVSAALRAMFPEKSLRLIVRTPQPFVGGAAALQAVYAKSALRPVRDAVAAGSSLRFYYEKFGPPGGVATRERDADLGVERVAFANGVRLNLRPSRLEPEHFRLLVGFAQNAAAVPKNRPGLAELAGAVVTTAHTGKHLENELKRILQLRGVTREFNVTDGTVHFAFSGPSRELGFTLRLIAAYLSDLRPDPIVFRNDLARYHGYRSASMNDVTRRAMLQSLYAFGGNDARLLLPPTDSVANYKFDEVLRWIDAHWLKGPLEIGVVGDFDAAAALAQAAASVGALPPRVAPRPAKPLGAARRASRRDLAGHTAGGSATSCVLWPLAGGDEPRANAALGLAVDVLGDRLRRTLREALGATYSPGTGVRRDRVQRDFAFAWMMNTFKPDQADRYTDQALAIAAALAKGGVTAEEFARLREPARTRCGEDLLNNGWWLHAVVAPAQSRPAALAMARTHATICDDLTLDEVNRAAQVFAAPATVTIVRPDRAK